MRKLQSLWVRRRLSRTLLFAFGFIRLMQAAFAQDPRLDFNIPAQPLTAALERYGDVTGRNVLYNSDLVTGRRSTAVQGHFSPDAALTKLLGGTELSAAQVTPTSFTLLSAPAQTAALPQSAVMDYYARIQMSLHDALCDGGSAQPGNYRIVMRLWIDSAGSVVRYERLSSTGASSVDSGIDHALQHLKIGARPPAELAQPVSVIVIPRGPGVTMSCVDPVPGRNGVLP
jgi:hypothetical protein